jgi:hypothetical protein
MLRRKAIHEITEVMSSTVHGRFKIHRPNQSLRVLAAVLALWRNVGVILRGILWLVV